jgi:hypothetical protein
MVSRAGPVVPLALLDHTLAWVSISTAPITKTRMSHTEYSPRPEMDYRYLPALTDPR